MGQYLAVGIATNICIEKHQKEKEEILNIVKESIDLNIFNINETDDYIDLEIKEDIFRDNIVDLIKELSKFYSKEYKEFAQKVIKKIEDKTYNEMMEIAKDRFSSTIGFQFLEGSFGCNYVSYIGKNISANIDIIEFISNGKIIMECYNNMFQFLRNNIINNLKSTLKTAVFITIVG